MKKNIINLILAFLLATVVSSCHFLDTQVYNVTETDKYYNTAEQLEQAVRGIYAILNESSLYGDAMLGRLGLDADLGYEYYKKDAGTVSYYETNTTDFRIANYWRSLYTGIARANMLLENIDKAEKVSDSERNRMKGEALFFRGFYYYMLVVRFQNIPLVLHSVSDINTDEKYVAQSSPAAVYARIIADLKEAALLVPDTTESSVGTRVTKCAVWGIIARVALSMAGNPVGDTSMYAIAAKYARMVIDSGVHWLNPSFEQVFINYARKVYDIHESIFEVNFWGDNQGSYATAGCVGRTNGIASSELSPVGYCMGVLRCSPILWYKYDSMDLRRDWTMSAFRYDGDTATKKYDDTESPIITRKYAAKFRREYESSTSKNAAYTDINFPILRYSDVLLMYAEAYAAQPSCADRDLALQCLNQVRRRGHGLDVGAKSSFDFYGNDSEMLDEIRDERARELAYECTRKDDLVRWGIFYESMQMAYMYLDGNNSSYQRAANIAYSSARPRDVMWPIPARELSVNSLLKQNPSW